MPNVRPFSNLSDFDIALYQAGKHFQLHHKMGSHITELDGEQGVCFSVWAPNAKRVSVTGDFNGWDPDAHILLPRWDSSGIWEGFIPGLGKGTVYKYHVKTWDGFGLDKGDPFEVLGAHEVELKGRKAVAIRAFLPYTQQVWAVLRDGTEHALERVTGTDFFEGVIPLSGKGAVAAFFG